MKISNKLVVLLFSIIGFLSGCGNDPQKDIIGYWMRGDGYTISFVDETTCSFSQNSLETYKIYDGNHLQVVDYETGSVSEFVFEINGDTLKLRLPSEAVFTEFTKNEKEQQKIMEEVNKWENVAIEEQLLQEQVDNIQMQIENIIAEIDKIQNEMNWNNSAIENNKKDIRHWEEAIQQAYVDYEDAIMSGLEEEYHRNERDDFIAAYNESIQSCNERIAELETENKKYQGIINNYQAEIERLQEEEYNLFAE